MSQQAITTSGSARPDRCSPIANADAFCAMHDGLIHSQPLRQRVLSGNHHVDLFRLRRQ